MICNCAEHFSTCLQYSNVQEKHAQIHYILKNLTDLLESEISCLMGRQLELFDHYFRLQPQAHFVHDLAYVCRLLELIPSKMYESDLFKDYYEKYLYLSGLPPLMLQSSELISCTKDVEEFFSVLGGLLFYLKDESHIHILLESIISLLSSRVKWPPCFMPLQRLQKAAVNSRLPQIAARFLIFASGEIYEKILRICILLAETSTTACHRIIEEGAVDSLLIQLEPNWRSRPEGIPPSLTPESKVCYYEEFSTLMWLLLKSLTGSNLSEITNNFPELSRLAFWNLRYALSYFYNNKKSKVDRNNILAITLKILKFFPKTEFLNSGLALDILQLNSVVEAENLSNMEWSGLQITACSEDFIFVRLLLMFLPQFNRTEYFGGMQYLRDLNIVQLKLKLLSQSHLINWHKDHLEKLICIVGSVLAEIVENIVDLFLASRGAKMMMDLVVSDAFSIEVILTMLRSILIMGRIEKVKAQMIIHRMLDAKISYMLIAFCEKIMSKETLDFKYQLALAYTFALLARLYKRKTTISNKRIITLTINLLKRIRSPNERDHTILPILPIMIISTLWNIFLCDEENLKQFLKDEGVYITLDLAETCVWPVKLVALGLLCEICQEAVAIPFFITWRGTRNQKILPFLMALFREENEMIGVKQNADGLIIDVEYPVMGIEQYKSVSNPQNVLECCPAISDLIGSCRPKIYAIIVLLTIRHGEEVRRADEIYKMWNEDELCLKDQLTKVVAENFFALKIAEVWNELELHFERYGVRPLADDYEMLSIILTRCRRWGIYLQEKQLDILRANCEKEEIKENLLYMDLRESRIGDTLSACRELDYIARCTKDIYRINTKKKTNTNILKNPIKNTDPDILYHTSFMYDIMVNPVFDQVLHIANVDPNEVKPQMSQWLKRAISKIFKQTHEKLPMVQEDELWGSIMLERCMDS